MKVVYCEAVAMCDKVQLQGNEQVKPYAKCSCDFCLM